MDSEGQVLLYGGLDVWIYGASNLPNMDTFSESLRKCVTICRPCIRGMSSVDVQESIHSDPYACVILKGATVARTQVISNASNPQWHEHFEIPVAHTVSEVVFVVKDNDIMGAQFIGQVLIPAEKIVSEKAIERRSFSLVGKDNKPLKPDATLEISIKYTSVAEDPSYRNGICAGPNHKGVQKTYFPMRKGGRVTLYQDAHVPDGCLPTFELQNGMKFEQGKCWEDIYQAIVDARHLVYVAGWSIYTSTKLIRDGIQGKIPSSDRTLGELLKHKAEQETARVLLLVWDDKTSHSVIGNVGVMGTHDEDTRRFFKHTNVACLLAPRYADKKSSWFKQKVVGSLYTHHQKIVIVDAPALGNARRLVAFIGGLDLCDGRYDTPKHTLFKNLNTTFADDYHNPTFATTAESGGPRQPWHDLHCKIEGPAAYDVLKNFEQRWKKAAKWHGFRLMVRKGVHWYTNVFVDLKQVPWIISPSSGQDCYVTKLDDPESWHVQIFRSIDSGSAKGFPKNVKDIADENLVSGKNIAIDMSIHTAYVSAIRSAQHFIYIENQYFLGSSFAWPTSQEAGANHLVPIELALKIVSKIRANERFSVYVVIPMWPEGIPTSSSVQEILHFQSQTMEMMYLLIAKALRETGLDKEYHPTDYLSFFCLGNREEKGDDTNEAPASTPVDEGTIQAQVQKSRRFMIYVHAKGMVVDDEYVILGSANINQRSMAGSRDTEIAMGAYQPVCTWAHSGSSPRGQVYGYRRSLWAEHLNVEDERFKEPWSVECMREVRRLAEENWKRFAQEEVVALPGHLLLYPLQVESSGKVVALSGYEAFPDVGGSVLGYQTNLPDSLTC